MASYKKYQTKKGTKWKFQLFMGRDPHGKQIIKTRSGYDTKKEASTAAVALEKQLNNESLLDNQYLTFKQVYNLWFENYKLTVKESTSAVIGKTIQYNIIPLLGDCLITEITTAQCQNAVNSWFNRGLKNYGLMFNYLNKILDYAVQLKYLTESPANAVIIPNSKQQKKDDLRLTNQSKKHQSKNNFFKRGELKTFLDYIEKDPNKMKFPFFRLLAFTGARSGEICALTWSDIDFSNNSIVISKTRAYSSHGLIVQTPKTEHSQRTIYIDDKTKNILKQWQLNQRKIMLLRGYNVSSPDQLVFSNTHNKLLSSKAISKWLNKVIAETGLKSITSSGFRHTFATLAIQGGMQPKELQNQLGHTDIKTTLNIYTSVTETQMQNVPDKFTAFVNF